jgi:hypothetical protein
MGNMNVLGCLKRWNWWSELGLDVCLEGLSRQSGMTKIGHQEGQLRGFTFSKQRNDQFQKMW